MNGVGSRVLKYHGKCVNVIQARLERTLRQHASLLQQASRSRPRSLTLKYGFGPLYFVE